MSNGSAPVVRLLNVDCAIPISRATADLLTPARAMNALTDEATSFRASWFCW